MAVQGVASDAPPCPDPSAHQHPHNPNAKLSEQASAAALYVTQPEKGTNPRENILGPDGRLSSKSAATSLKYARPQDLPSYPIIGVNNAGTANEAANLANGNRSSPSYWQPGAPSSDASKAAMIAKDYKMAPLWQSELSAASSKAALLAHKDGGKLDLWMPEATKEGNSAAGIAMRNKGLSPQLDYGYTEDGHKRAMMAATMSVNHGRQRAASIPTPVNPAYPDSANSAHNALSAASVSHRNSTRAPPPKDSNLYASDAMQAARVQNSHMDRQLFTEHPDVQLEKDERNHNNAMRAAAVGMAKEMYQYQNRTVLGPDLTGGLHAAQAAQKRDPPPTDVKQEALKYIHLQEAAQKLAAERLAKVDKEHEAKRWRDHYYEQQTPQKRMSMRGRNRDRASSEGNKDADSSDDDLKSRRIRSQMAGLTGSLAEVDAKKQQNDRANLLAAAQKKVQARMHDMDEKLFMETGKVSPAMMEEWEKRAREKAESDRDARQDVNKGKVHVGGGKYMDQSEIDAIAQNRLQPTLDEINDTAERKRAHDEEVRLEQEEERRQKLSEKEKEKDRKNEEKRIRNEEKATAKAQKNEQKQAEKIEKDAGKARKAEEKRIQKEDKRKSRDVRKEEEGAAAGAAVGVGAAGAATVADEPKESVEEPEAGIAPTGGFSGHQTDAVPVSTEEAIQERPDLERHISRIPADSDDEVEDEEGEAESLHPGGEVSAHDTASRVLSAPIAGVTTRAASETPYTVVHDDVVEPTTAEAGAATESTPAAKSEKPALSGIDTAAPAPPPVKTGPGATEHEATSPTKRDGKGIKGLFSRLTNKRSKADTKVAEPAPTPTTATSDKGFVGGAALTGASSKESAVPSASDPIKSSTETAAAPASIESAGVASPSSFRRHEGSLGDVSSLSSSGADEEDVARGRTGRTAGMLSSFGKGKAKAADKDSDDGEEFEEARDNFDESLAPPPAFAGQAKTGSPVRGTKFVEEL